MNELQTRLKEIRKYLKLTQGEFGKGIGISQGGYGALETGVRALTDRTISQICQTYSVNEDWLSTGAGEMFIDDTPALIERMKDELNLSEREIEILTVFLDFSPEERQQVLDFARDFAAKLTAHRAQDGTEDVPSPAPAQDTAPAANSPADPAPPIDMDAIDAEVAAYRAELIAEKKAAARSSASTSTHAAKNA